MKPLIRSEQKLELLEKSHFNHFLFRFVGPYSLDVMTSASFSIDTDTTVNPDAPLSVQLRNLLKFKIWPFFLISTFYIQLFLILVMERKWASGRCHIICKTLGLISHYYVFLFQWLCRLHNTFLGWLASQYWTKPVWITSITLLGASSMTTRKINL